MASQLNQDQRNNDEILNKLIIQCNIQCNKRVDSLKILQLVLSCDEKRVKTNGSSLINVFQLDNDGEENQSVELAILRAFLNDSPEFVELFLDLVDLESFLTVGQLEEFYNHKTITDSAKKYPLFKLYPFENNEKIITNAGLKSFFKEHFFDDFEVMFLPDNSKEGASDGVKFPAKNL